MGRQACRGRMGKEGRQDEGGSASPGDHSWITCIKLRANSLDAGPAPHASRDAISDRHQCTGQQGQLTKCGREECSREGGLCTWHLGVGGATRAQGPTGGQPGQVHMVLAVCSLQGQVDICHALEEASAAQIGRKSRATAQAHRTALQRLHLPHTSRHILRQNTPQPPFPPAGLRSVRPPPLRQQQQPTRPERLQPSGCWRGRSHLPLRPHGQWRWRLLPPPRAGVPGWRS